MCQVLLDAHLPEGHEAASDVFRFLGCRPWRYLSLESGLRTAGRAVENFWMPLLSKTMNWSSSRRSFQADFGGCRYFTGLASSGGGVYALASSLRGHVGTRDQSLAVGGATERRWGLGHLVWVRTVCCQSRVRGGLNMLVREGGVGFARGYMRLLPLMVII